MSVGVVLLVGLYLNPSSPTKTEVTRAVKKSF
jgi:hypothetical protein